MCSLLAQYGWMVVAYILARIPPAAFVVVICCRPVCRLVGVGVRPKYARWPGGLRRSTFSCTVCCLV